MSSREEVLGKIVRLIGRIDDQGGLEALNILSDVMEKLVKDFSRHDWALGRQSEWLTQLKRLARKEPCWESKLPFRAEERRFIGISRIALLGSEPWTAPGLISEMNRRGGSLSLQEADHYLSMLDYLGATRRTADGCHEVAMAPQEFEVAFGVKLSN